MRQSKENIDHFLLVSL